MVNIQLLLVIFLFLELLVMWIFQKTQYTSIMQFDRLQLATIMSGAFWDFSTPKHTGLTLT